MADKEDKSSLLSLLNPFASLKGDADRVIQAAITNVEVQAALTIPAIIRSLFGKSSSSQFGTQNLFEGRTNPVTSYLNQQPTVHAPPAQPEKMHEPVVSIDPLPELDDTPFIPPLVNTGDPTFDANENETRQIAADGLTKVQTNLNNSVTFLYRQINNVATVTEVHGRQISHLKQRFSTFADDVDRERRRSFGFPQPIPQQVQHQQVAKEDISGGNSTSSNGSLLKGMLGGLIAANAGRILAGLGRTFLPIAIPLLLKEFEKPIKDKIDELGKEMEKRFGIGFHSNRNDVNKQAQDQAKQFSSWLQKLTGKTGTPPGVMGVSKDAAQQASSLVANTGTPPGIMGVSKNARDQGSSILRWLHSSDDDKPATFEERFGKWAPPPSDVKIETKEKTTIRTDTLDMDFQRLKLSPAALLQFRQVLDADAEDRPSITSTPAIGPSTDRFRSIDPPPYERNIRSSAIPTPPIRSTSQMTGGIGDDLFALDKPSLSEGMNPDPSLFSPLSLLQRRNIRRNTGGYGTTSNANYMKGPLPSKDDLKTIETAAGKITVHKDAANDIKGFIDDLIAAGAPPGEIGSYNVRTIAGSSRMSQHSYGTAIDYAQHSRNVVDARFRAWADANPDKLQEILQKHNMISGGDWRNPDFGHFEWAGPQRQQQQSSDAMPIKSGKGSWFSQFQGRYSWVDRADKPGSAASGLPDEVPGIALRDKSTLGHYFTVTGPDGQSHIVRQTDIGPSRATGRDIDINAALAEKMGYSPKTFPTDANFQYQYIGPNNPQLIDKQKKTFIPEDKKQTNPTTTPPASSPSKDESNVVVLPSQEPTKKYPTSDFESQGPSPGSDGYGTKKGSIDDCWICAV